MAGDIERVSRVERRVQELGNEFVRRRLPDIDDDSINVAWLDVTALTPSTAMPNQDVVTHPVLLVAGWLFQALINFVSGCFTSPYENHNKQLIFLCHSLKNQGHITFEEYVKLNKALIGEGGSRQAFKEELIKLLGPFKESGFLNRRGSIQVYNMLQSNRLHEGLQYLNTVSCLNIINANQREACQILTPEEALTLGTRLERALDRSEFDKDAAESLHSLLSRIQILKWSETLELTVEQQNELSSTLRAHDSARFKEVMAELLQVRGSALPGLMQEYYRDLEKSLNFQQHEDVFIHFAHGLVTERVVQDWNMRFTQLKEEIEAASAEELTSLIPQLRRLYTIFGHMLVAEEQYFNSVTAFNHVYGDIKLKWEEINDFISEQLEAPSTHLTCGCSHHEVRGEHDGEHHVHAWPQTATTVVSASRVDTPRDHIHPKKIKVFLGTCRYGTGHKTAIEAIRDYLGKKDFHVHVVDTSRDVLITEDFAYNFIGKDYSQERIFNTALAGEHFGMLDVLQGGASIDVFEGPSEVQKRLLGERMLRERPDIIVADEPINNELYRSVAEALGIPFLYVPTDLDCETRLVESIPEGYEHFKMIMPVDDADVRATVRGKVPESAMVPLGYPVRPQFIDAPDPAVLQAQKDAYGMKADDRLVMVMGGGAGAKSPYFEETIRGMVAGSVPKTHIVAVCGYNTSLKEEYERMKEKYPSVADRIHVEGFCAGDKMALLMHATDVILTKPGGATVAEGLQTKTKMLFKLNSSFAWERTNLEWVKARGMGNEITDDKPFIETLVSELDRPLPEHADSLTPSESQATSYRELIEEMVDAARRDEAMREKQHAWRRDISIPVLPELAHRSDKLPAAMIEMRDMLTHVIPNIRITDATTRAIAEGAHVRISEAGVLEETPAFNRKETEAVLKHFHHIVKEWNALDEQVVSPDRASIRGIARNVLRNLTTQINFSRKSDPLVQVATELDMHLVAAEMRSQEITKERFRASVGYESDRAALVAAAQERYTTPTAKEIISSWVFEKTATGREKDTDSFVSNAFDAVFCTLARPQSVLDAKEMKLHRTASAYDHTLTYRPNGDVEILVNGSKMAMEALRHRYEFYQGRIIDKATSAEHIYSDNLGIIPGSRDLWEGRIPIFKKKADRKTKDYRMEIVTDRNHAWLRMKDPEGNIYSIGKHWDKDVDERTFSTIPGSLEASDIHEFIGKESEQKRTVIPLTKAKYKEVMAFIVEEQEQLIHQQRGFNMVGDNCASFVAQVAKIAGVQVADEPSLIHVYGEPLPLLKTIYNSSIFVKALLAPPLYLLSVFRNLIMFIGGGMRSADGEAHGRLDNRIFTNFFEIFNPYKGMYKHTSMIREWQDNSPKKLRNRAAEVEQAPREPARRTRHRSPTL